MINHAVSGEVHCDQTITKCLYKLFPGVERTCRISLTGFSDYPCVGCVDIAFLK